MFIFPYKKESESAKALQVSLGIQRIKNENSKFKGRADKVVINWGATKLPDEVLKCIVLNAPASVAQAVDKRIFLETNKEFCPPFTLDIEEAKKWLNKGLTVVVRNKVNGAGGEGIEIISNEQELKPAPLYTRYIPKKEEYRLHVFNGEVFFVQRKARVKEVADAKVNWQVRNMAGGFIFANQNIEVAQAAKDIAISCVGNLGLDFGAVDLIFNEKANKYYSLEVNTAPGLCGLTLTRYVEQFKKVRN